MSMRLGIRTEHRPRAGLELSIAEPGVRYGWIRRPFARKRAPIFKSRLGNTSTTIDCDLSLCAALVGRCESAHVCAAEQDLKLSCVAAWIQWTPYRSGSGHSARDPSLVPR